MSTAEVDMLHYIKKKIKKKSLKNNIIKKKIEKIKKKRGGSWPVWGGQTTPHGMVHPMAGKKKKKKGFWPLGVAEPPPCRGRPKTH
jgi:hypothetical protein